MNIGLFFGSFNPIHNGHIEIAKYMLDNICFDEVWFVISPKSPFKKNNLIDKKIRKKWVDLALKKQSKLRSCSIEFNLPEPSYTINTLGKLKEKYKKYTFSIILGGDNYKTIHKWERYNEIITGYKLYIYPRDRKENKINHPNIIIKDTPIINISSTEICMRLLEGKAIKQFVPKEIYLSLCQHFLNQTFK